MSRFSEKLPHRVEFGETGIYLSKQIQELYAEKGLEHLEIELCVVPIHGIIELAGDNELWEKYKYTVADERKTTVDMSIEEYQGQGEYHGAITYSCIEPKSYDSDIHYVVGLLAWVDGDFASYYIDGESLKLREYIASKETKTISSTKELSDSLIKVNAESQLVRYL